MQTYEEKLEKKRQYSKERAEWLKEHHMCVWCGKEKAEVGKLCYNCWVKSREHDFKKYRSMSDEEKRTYLEKKCDYRKAKRAERREKGLCTICGKPLGPFNGGKVRCAECRNKRNRYQMELRRKAGIIPFEDRGNGIYCARCCKPVEHEGNKLCDKCYIEHVEKAKHMRECQTNGNYWEDDNKIVFMKRGVKE